MFDSSILKKFHDSSLIPPKIAHFAMPSLITGRWLSGPLKINLFSSIRHVTDGVCHSKAQRVDIMDVCHAVADDGYINAGIGP